MGFITLLFDKNTRGMYYRDGGNYLIVVYLIYLFSRETVQRCMVFSAFFDVRSVERMI